MQISRLECCRRWCYSKRIQVTFGTWCYCFLQLLSHTIYRKEPVTVVPTSSVEKSVIIRFGDAFDEILPSSFDNLPYFAELVDTTTKKSIGSMGSEQQLLILLSRFIKLRYPSDVFGDSQESGSLRFLFIFSLTLKWSFLHMFKTRRFSFFAPSTSRSAHFYLWVIWVYFSEYWHPYSLLCWTQLFENAWPVQISVQCQLLMFCESSVDRWYLCTNWFYSHWRRFSRRSAASFELQFANNSRQEGPVQQRSTLCIVW